MMAEMSLREQLRDRKSISFLAPTMTFYSLTNKASFILKFSDY